MQREAVQEFLDPSGYSHVEFVARMKTLDLVDCGLHQISHRAKVHSRLVGGMAVCVVAGPRQRRKVDELGAGVGPNDESMRQGRVLGDVRQCKVMCEGAAKGVKREDLTVRSG